MEQTEADRALARVEAAITRIERAAGGTSDLAQRHARLRAAVQSSLQDIDILLGGETP